VDRSILGPQDFIQTNINGTFTLLEASRGLWAGSRNVRFHHISTDEVYGSLGETGSFLETTPYDPRSPYSASKAASDHLVRAYFHTYGIPVTISNCSNNYGPYQFPEKFIPLLLRNGLNGLEFPVYGDGLQIRDWLHVHDNCRAILEVLDHGQIGSIYNIGTGEERTNLDVVEAIRNSIPKGRSAIRGTSVRLVADRPGHDRRYALDTAKIRKELDWTPKISFSAGIRQTVDWYLGHAEWIARVTSGEYRSYYESVYAQTWGKSS
jgi:dTDP-glucose 4,6-dehydratase